MKKILVVDDDRTAVKALRILLELDGYEATACDSGGAALEALKNGAFDAVVTDLEMPGANGIEVVRAARGAPSPLPVLLVTAYAGSPFCQKALDAGAKRALPKPLRYEALLAELASLFEA
jgi:two-component system response regulator PrrA